MNNKIYEIKLPHFEGPFDLLLFFIERDELDIYDIPIAKISDDFLTYLHELEMLNIDLASEFILVAATLMRIKAKTLLPRKELNELGEEIDPRLELVERLIAYKSFKETVLIFQSLENNRLERFDRGNLEQEINLIAQKFNTEWELESVSLFKLLKVFAKVTERFEKREQIIQHIVEKPEYTIEKEKENLLKLVFSASVTAFLSIFETCTDKIEAIFRFLAMLELVQEQKISLDVGEGINNFWLKPTN